MALSGALRLWRVPYQRGSSQFEAAHIFLAGTQHGGRGNHIAADSSRGIGDLLIIESHSTSLDQAASITVGFAKSRKNQKTRHHDTLFCVDL